MFSGDCLWNRNSGVSITTSTHSHYSTTTTHSKSIQNTFYIYTSCPSSSVQPCAPSPPPCSLLPASWWWWREGNTGIASHKILFFQKKLCESYSFCTTAVCLHFSRQAVIHAFIHPHSHHISHSCMHSRYFGSQPTIQSSFLLHHHHPHHHVISYDKALYFHTQHQQQSFRPFTSSSRLLSGYLCYSCRRRCCLNLFIKIALLNVDKMDTESGR